MCAGRRDAFLYLTELVLSGCAGPEQFTVVAQACKGKPDEAQGLEYLRELLQGSEVQPDSLLSAALGRQ